MTKPHLSGVLKNQDNILRHLSQVYWKLNFCSSEWEEMAKEDSDYMVALGSQEFAAFISSAKVEVVEAMRILGSYPGPNGEVIAL